MVKLGDRGQDAITGFEGIVTARVEYISGCVQVCVTPGGLDEKGQIRKGEYFDIQRVHVVNAGAVVLDNGATPGGPQRDAPPAR